LLAAAVISFCLLLLLMPALQRYTLAKPNARSSHQTPTPQGGGIGVMAAAILVAASAAIVLPIEISNPLGLAVVFAAATALAVVGFVDDLRPLDAMTRLVLQGLAVAAVLVTMRHDWRVVPSIPWWVERMLAFAALLWFVNLVNFMDGIDWITVAEVVPITAALGVFGALGALPGEATITAIALCGALIAFAPFNRPVARLFLGDVGSLPIGLLLAWLLILLALRGHLFAAILLPLYYLGDATITLFRRLIKGERVMQAHRSHFYQRATDNGFTVSEIVAHVFVVNLILVALAATTIISGSHATNAAAASAGVVVVGALLLRFSRARASD
jgi:UDP-N-acetylmuramyl pentapeptide phosphotransferase/UDP-N-acetylglucosamine-1-phosphate transferase